jgi:hypothetical protein
VGEVKIFIFHQVTHLDFSSIEAADKKMSREQKKAILELLSTSVTAPNHQAGDILKVSLAEIDVDCCKMLFSGNC